MRARNILLLIAAGLASAALAYLGTGLHPLWWALWLAPVPVLAVAPRLRRSVAFLLASLAWLIGELNQLAYFRHGIELSLPVIIILLVIPAAVFGLGVLFARAFLRQGLLLLAALAFAATWVTYEYLSEISSPHSTFGNLAYSQMDCLPLIQIACVTGVSGISFLVFLFAGGAAALFSGRGNWSQRRTLAIVVGVILGVVFLFGEWRLRANPPAQSVAITLLAKDVPMSLYLGSEDEGLHLLHEYADEVRRATAPGTEVVVLPEKIARVSEKAVAEVDALFSSAAAATHSAIVLGVVRQTSSAAFNSSRLYSPDGKLEANYDKHHLLPGVEREKPGNTRVVVDQPSGRWGLQICKDLDFPDLSREYANDGTNLLLVPAWDFNLDRWLHARMAVLRAVENGFALARSGRNGLLTLTDNRGRILAEAATVPGRFVSINGKVDLVRETTFYTRTGDWFAWLCIATFVVLLVSRILPPTAARRKAELGY